MSGSCGVVTFNWYSWATQYPELSSIQAPQAQGFFNQACLYLDNTPRSMILDASVGGVRETILYMLTSHITVLLATIAGIAPSPLVGRINSAGQGSVNVTTEMPAPMSAAWFNQSRYGAMAYQAMAPYFSALYVAAPQVPLGMRSYPGFIGGWFR